MPCTNFFSQAADIGENTFAAEADLREETVADTPNVGSSAVDVMKVLKPSSCQKLGLSRLAG